MLTSKPKKAPEKKAEKTDLAPSASAAQAAPAVDPRFEALVTLCRRAVETLKAHSGGNEHIEVQANVLLDELKKLG